MLLREEAHLVPELENYSLLRVRPDSLFRAQQGRGAGEHERLAASEFQAYGCEWEAGRGAND